ncbi:MAG: DUF975 family protein [Acutalibacteraceae bacterium]|nr:DUF975 family protein [Acutalibacteraceae bacterium]
MRSSSDLRFIARRALTGRWGVAIGSSIVASFLGGIYSANINFNFNYSDNETAGNSVFSWFSNLTGSQMVFLGAAGAFLLNMALVFSIARLFIGSIVGIGYARFNLDLVDNVTEARFATLFSYMRFWKVAIITRIARTLYILLWTLLFIIPGIIASYNYALTDYILAENPELTTKEALELSKKMMYGHRFRLFCLEFSFIGWAFLCVLSLGIGLIWLLPYTEVAKAAFYRDVSFQYNNPVTNI